MTFRDKKLLKDTHVIAAKVIKDKELSSRLNYSCYQGRRRNFFIDFNL